MSSLKKSGNNKPYSKASYDELEHSRYTLENDDEKSVMLDNLMNEIPGGVAVIKVGNNLICQYYNDGFAAMSDRSRDEMDEALKKPLFLENMIYDQDRDEIEAEIIRQTDKGKALNITYRYLSKDGEIRWTHMSGNKLHDDEGCPVYYCIFSKPSGETTLYRKVVEDSSSGIAVVERKSHRIVYANSAMELYYNAGSIKDMIGRNVADVIKDKSALISEDGIAKLHTDRYSQFHKLFSGNRYLSIRARALEWNGVDSYIVYIADETKEYKRNMQQRDLLNKVPSGIGIYEICKGKATQVYMNDFYYKMIGVEREQRKKIASPDFLYLVNPEDLPAVKALIKSFSDGSDVGYVNHRIICGDGTYRWFRLVGNVVERQADKLIVYCNYTDFEETMNVQNKLKSANFSIRMEYEKEQQKRNFLEKSSIIDITINITKDNVVEIRNRGKSVKLDDGTMTCREYMSKLQNRMPTAGDRTIIEDCFDRSRNLFLLKKGIDERHEEFRYRFNDGVLHWLRADSSMSVDADTGDVIAYVFVKDIDDDKKRQIVASSVIDKDTDYVAIVSVITGITKLIRIKDSYGVDTNLNRKPFEFDSFLQKRSTRNIVSEDIEKVQDFFNLSKLKKAIAGNQVANAIFRKKEKDGSVRRKRLHAYYLDGEHEDIVVVCRDITDFYEEELKQKHKLQEALTNANNANRAKSEFLSNMSHDIRTPLNAVLGFADLAKDSEGITQETVSYLDKIIASGKYLLGLVNDILDMSKMENGKMKLYEEKTDELEFLNGIAEIFRSQAQLKGISLVTDFSSVGRNLVMMDKLRSQQIYSNLLSNAIKFSNSGTEIKWTVTEAPLDNPEMDNSCKDNPILDVTVHVVSSIQDHGCGMSKEFMTRMFQPFEQNDPSNELTGTGLGLSIVKNLVTLMGGTVRAESKQGIGSTFIVEIDRMVVKGDTNMPLSMVEKIQLKGIHILLCEDNSVNTMVAEKILEKFGCIVDSAENGKEGLEKFRSSELFEYDIILMDIRMPVMNGYEATRAILALDREDAATVPVVAMSANVFDEDIRKCKEVGMRTYISKPIDVKQLCKVLSEQTKLNGRDKK